MEGVNVAVVFPAAGKGLRIGGERKQFRKLGDKPLLYQSVRRFEAHPAVKHIVVAAPESEMEVVRDIFLREDVLNAFDVVSGGASRQESVYAALEAVPDKIDIVLVHDAVRPFVDLHLIDKIVEAVMRAGAASLAVPVADTLRSVEGRHFASTVPRKGLFRMQTPQGARREWLLDAYARAKSEGWQASDDVDLLQRAGYRVECIEGSSLNIKITTRTDWELACLIWPDWSGMM